MPKADPFITIEPVNFKELSKKYANSREYLLVSLNTGLRRAGKELTPAVKDATPVGATGKLRSTTVFQVLGKAEDMRMEVRQSAFSKDKFPYGVAVRTGTRPHFPPIDALVPWVIKKLGVPSEEARSVAFLVARKISRVGTEAQPYHINVMKAKANALKRIFAEEVTNMVAKLHDIPRMAG